MSMNAQRAVETAYAANAVEFANVEATRIFRNELDNTISVPYILTAAQKKEVQDNVDFPLRFTCDIPCTNDHPVLVSYRAIIRQIAQSQSKVRTTSLKTLVVGSAAREYHQYGSNPNVFFHFALKEAKDKTRVVQELLETTLKKIRKNATSSDKRLFYTDDDPGLASNSRVVRFRTARTMLKRVAKVDGTELRVVFDDLTKGCSRSFSQLVFEDVGYNFSEEDWCNIFEQTGAQTGDGYMFLPLELIFPHLPDNDSYNYYESPTFGGMRDATVTYKGGVSNGYTHDKNRWSTLLRKMVLTNGRISLAVELTSRVGPMFAFKMSVCQGKETLVRSLAVPENMRYVRILDLNKYVINDGREKVYKSVKEVEYFNTLVYCLSLSVKSLEIENVVTYVRRMRAGVSMANAEFIKPWSIDNGEIYNFALVVLIQAKYMKDATPAVLDKGQDAITLHRKWLDILKGLGKVLCVAATVGTVIPLHALYVWLKKKHIIDELTIVDDMQKYQRDRLCTDPYVEQPIDVEVMAHETEAGEITGACPICEELEGQLGEQVLRCGYREDTNHTFDITTADLREYRRKLDEQIDAAPTALANFLRKVKTSIPTVGFKHTVVMNNFKGGPGTGKSFIARALYDNQTMIVGPFNRLEADYKDVPVPGTDQTRNYDYRTMHRAVEAHNKINVFFDEWTSIDYVLMGIIVRNVGARNVFLFGDINQTGVLHSEGRPPAMSIDFSKLSEHTLMKNFRNTQYTVALLNQIYGYGMYAVSNVLGLPTFNVIEDEETDVGDMTPMTYSHATADLIGMEGDRRPTVRSFQGSTVDKTALFYMDTDVALINNSQLFCVAVSRDRNGMTFFTDSEEANTLMRAKCRIDDHDFIDKIGVLCRPDITAPIKAFEGDDLLSSFEEEEIAPVVVKEKGFLGGLVKVAKPSVSVLTETQASGLISPATVTPRAARSLFEDVEGEFPLSLEGNVVGGWCTLATLMAQVAHDNLRDYKTFVLSHQSTRDGVAFETFVAYCEKKNLPVFIITRNGTILRADKKPKVWAVVDDDFSHMDPFDPSTKFKFFIEKVDGSVIHEFEVGALSLWEPLNKYFHSRTAILERYADQGMAAYKLPLWKYASHTNEIFIMEISGATSMEMVKQTVFKFDDPALEEKVSYYPGHNGEEYSMRQQPVFETRLINRESRATYDSFRDAELILPEIGVQGVTTSFNESFSNTGMMELTRNGTLTENFFFPINQRGHPKSQSQKGFVASRGFGNRYFTNNRWQSVQAFAHRYVRRKTLYRFSYAAARYAKKIADLAVAELFDFEKLHSEFSFEECSRIQNEFRRAALSKNYPEKFEGEKFSDVRQVNYHLKDIFKPAKNGKIDPSKPGQGISAWSASANLDFGAAMRIISAKFRSSLKGNVLFNNGYTEEEFSSLLNKQLSMLPASSIPGVVDGKEFDSMQNEFTQEIEKNILKSIGVSDEFILDYYSYRKNYKLIAVGMFSGNPECEKTSGEPGTLLLNSILELVLMNAILRGVGPFVATVQGDDGLKHQSQLRVDEEVLDVIARYSDFKLTVEIGKDMEFCGDVIVGNVMHPCLYRTVQKICGNVFRDVNHFQEYQVSLRDKVAYIERLGAEDVLISNCKKYSINYETAWTIYDIIKSFSHINEEQFHEWFKPVEFSFTGPSL